MDFEFRLNEPASMLSADELFSNGKLVPLHLAPILLPAEPRMDIASVQPMHSRRREISEPDRSAFSPKAPRCSSRWKEMIGLKKARSSEAERTKAAAAAALKLPDTKSLMQLLHRNPARPSSNDSTLRFPLLRDSDSESASISARLSLSSSASSGADHEDHPRLSLDLDRINSTPLSLPPRAKFAKGRPPAIHRPAEFSPDKTIDPVPSPIRLAPESVAESLPACRVGHSPMPQLPEIGELPPLLGAPVDSPRLNASGKVIFQGLGRSSSSPSTFNGGPRPRPRGMERSYSANVRVTPVLNVPVCTLRGTAKSASVFGFGQLFLTHNHKREKENSSAKNGTSNSNGAITKS